MGLAATLEDSVGYAIFAAVSYHGHSTSGRNSIGPTLRFFREKVALPEEAATIENETLRAPDC